MFLHFSCILLKEPMMNKISLIELSGKDKRDYVRNIDKLGYIFITFLKRYNFAKSEGNS